MDCRTDFYRLRPRRGRFAPLMAVALAAAVVAPLALAGDSPLPEGQNVSEAKPEAEGSAAVAWRAARGLALAREAREQRSVPMMVAAVEVLRGVDLRTAVLGEPEVVASDQDATSRPRPKASDDVEPPLRASDMLEEARGWAGDDEVLVALLDRAAERLERQGAVTMGRVQGPAAEIKRVEARSRHVYRERFRGEQLARVVIVGDGDTDLDLFVYDENGNLIRSDIRVTDFVHVEWTPRWTGEFRIEVVNHGNVWNRYVMVTN